MSKGVGTMGIIDEYDKIRHFRGASKMHILVATIFMISRGWIEDGPRACATSHLSERKQMMCLEIAARNPAAKKCIKCGVRMWGQLKAG